MSLSLVAVACSSSPSTTIHVSDYARACVVAHDCVLAIDGDVCGVCANSAVARSDTAYASERARLEKSCSQTGGQGDCMAVAATCTAGLCGIVSCEAPDAAADGGACAP